MTDLKNKSEEYQKGYKQAIEDIKKIFPKMKEQLIKNIIITSKYDIYYDFYCTKSDERKISS